jgi:hypothetical protein
MSTGAAGLQDFFVCFEQVSGLVFEVSVRLRRLKVARTHLFLGEHERFTFPKRPVLDTRCRVQFETFQYNLLLW